MRQKRYRQLAEINVVPYIDVMLVLLIIFMVTAPLLFQGVDVNLPTANAKPIDTQQKEPIVLSIDRSGNYYLNIATTPNQPISAKEMLTLVSQELRGFSSQTERQTLIKGDRDINYGRVMLAMTLLQQAGAKNIGLITQPEEIKSH